MRHSTKLRWVFPSRRQGAGRLFALHLGVLAAPFLFSVLALAASSSEAPAEKRPEKEGGALPDEVSIKEDRKSLEDLRKEIPEPLRRENDELAALLALMPEGDQEPSEFRSRFSTLVNKKREAMDKIFRERREAYSTQERKTREKTLKALSDARTSYLKDKHSSDERNEFFGKQDDQRRSFFAKQEESRKDFESEMQDKRKQFDDYIREKTNRFNDIYRDYVSRYYDRKKNEDLKKRMDEKAREKARESGRETGTVAGRDPNRGTADSRSGASGIGADSVKGKNPEEEALLREFRALPPTPVTPLAPRDSN